MTPQTPGCVKHRSDVRQTMTCYRYKTLQRYLCGGVTVIRAVYSVTDCFLFTSSVLTVKLSFPVKRNKTLL